MSHDHLANWLAVVNRSNASKLFLVCRLMFFLLVYIVPVGQWSVTDCYTRERRGHSWSGGVAEMYCTKCRRTTNAGRHRGFSGEWKLCICSNGKPSAKFAIDALTPPPLDLSFWSFFTFLHYGIEEVETHLRWKFHKKIQRKRWSNVPPKLLACIGFLYKVVHKNGRFRKFNRAHEIEFNLF